MRKRSSTIITYALAILVTLSCVVNAASAIENCLPKACCCKKAATLANTAGHHGEKDIGCNGNAPCCEIKPSVPFPDMAIVAAPETPMPNPTAMAGAPDRHTATAPQTCLTTSFYTGINLKIPLPPIYLQNQSFLC